MKSIIRTITVLVVLNLTIAGFALAENASESVAVLNAELVEELGNAPVVLETGLVAESTAGLNVKDVSFAMTPQYSGSETALVIPTDQLKAEELSIIIEDLNIMSRIFDKKLNRDRKQLSVFGFKRDSNPLHYRRFFSGGDKATKAIYVQGFAALFLMKVDFPLVPAPEVKEDEVEEPADPVWDQTKREIYSQQEGEKGANWHYTKDTRASAEYDAEKVEELKRTLIKSLKHATNIRNLKPEEQVILVIRGSESVRHTKELTSQSSYDGRSLGTGGWTQEENVLIVSKEAGSSLPTVLVIIVKKSDIDAFSKGELDFDKFRQKTQIVVY